MPLTQSTDAGNIAGNIHSHRFPAANTALPYVNDDQQQLSDTEKFLTDHEVSVDIFAISPEAAAEKAASEAAGRAQTPAAAIGGTFAAPNLETTFAQGAEAAES